MRKRGVAVISLLAVGLAFGVFVKRRGAASTAGVTTTAAPNGQAQGPDAIVVGSGIAGLAAAYELAKGGAKVSAIDMASVFRL